MRIRPRLVTLFFSMAWSGLALGQDQNAIATARQLGEEGLHAYDAGQFEQAAHKLLSAYKIVKLPTLARGAARALAKQGRLVAASELYLEATRLTPNNLWRGEAQPLAQRDAAEERAKLLPRIAHLKVDLEGADARQTRITIDDVVVHDSLIGTERLTDPGKRHVVANYGKQTVEQDVDLSEGESKSLVIRFASTPEASSIRESYKLEAGSTLPTRAGTTATRPFSAQRTWGWVGLGIGAAGVAAGAGTGITALLMRSSLHSDGCKDDVCPRTDFQNRIDTYNSMLTAATVGFVVGGVGAAVGVSLLLTAPKRETVSRVSLLVGPGSVALTGGF